MCGQVGQLPAATGSAVPVVAAAVGHLPGRGPAHEGFSQIRSRSLPALLVHRAAHHGLSGAALVADQV